MKSVASAEGPLSRMLLGWMMHQVSQTLAAIRPAYPANHIATAVAASGNPSGV